MTDLPTFNKVVLDLAHFHQAQLIQRRHLEQLGEIELTSRIDQVTDSLVLSFHSKMIGAEPMTASVSARAYASVRYPRPTLHNLFKVWLKRDLEGGLVLRRWAGKVTVTYDSVEDEDKRTNSIDYFLKVCPHIAIPENRPHVEFLIGDSP